MAQMKFRADTKGIGEFLAGREVQKMVRRSGDAIARRAGPKFEADTWIAPTQGTSKRGNSTPPRAVSGVTMKRGSFPRGSRSAERLQQSIQAGRV